MAQILKLTFFFTLVVTFVNAGIFYGGYSGSGLNSYGGHRSFDGYSGYGYGSSGSQVFGSSGSQGYGSLGLYGGYSGYGGLTGSGHRGYYRWRK